MEVGVGGNRIGVHGGRGLPVELAPDAMLADYELLHEALVQEVLADFLPCGLTRRLGREEDGIKGVQDGGGEEPCDEVAQVECLSRLRLTLRALPVLLLLTARLPRFAIRLRTLFLILLHALVVREGSILIFRILRPAVVRRQLGY